MNRNYLQHALSTFVLLMAMIACVLPGQAAQPAPVTGPINIETAVAGTAQAAEKQTQQANPLPATAAPADTPTSTPKISSAGTSLATLADGSIQFTDYVAGIQVVIPSFWMVVRVGEQEYYAAWGKPETQNPVFVDIFNSLQSLDPKTFRMHAFDVRSDHIINNDVTQVDVVFIQGDERTLKKLRSDELNDPPRLKGYKVLKSNFFDLPQGIQALNIEIQWKSSNGASQTGLGSRRRVIFKAPGGAIAVDLNVLMDKKDLSMLDYEQLLNSIALFTP